MPRESHGRRSLVGYSPWGHEESGTTERLHFHAPNIGAPQYRRQTLTEVKGEIDSNTIIIGDFNTPFTPRDRSSKPKINMETQALNDTLDEMDLIDIFRTFHPTAEEYIFFSSAHGTFSRIDHILGHKSNLRKFKKVEIISSLIALWSEKMLDTVSIFLNLLRFDL